MKKRIILLFLLITMIPILSGCWNQKELTDLAFVMAFGVDKGSNNQKYDVSLQIVLPSNVSQGQNGGGGGGQGIPAVVYKSSGNTLTEAVRKATKALPRQYYFAHTNLLVISEEVARDSILDILDVLDRVPEFRTTTKVVIAQDTSAYDLVSIISSLEKIPTNKIVKTLDETEKRLGENMSVMIDDVILNIVSSGQEPVISGFTVEGNTEKGKTPNTLSNTNPPAIVHASDLAIFKEGKLIDWVRGDNARGVLWVLDKIKSFAISVDWKGKKDVVVMNSILSKTKVSARFKNGKPVINVSIKGEGNVNEADVPIELTNPHVIEELNILVAKKIKKKVETSIKTIQKTKSDVFGFGEVIHRSYPQEWKKLKENWGEEFAQLEVHVDVKTYHRRSGVRSLPFWSDMKK